MFSKILLMQEKKVFRPNQSTIKFGSKNSDIFSKKKKILKNLFDSLSPFCAFIFTCHKEKRSEASLSFQSVSPLPSAISRQVFLFSLNFLPLLALSSSLSRIRTLALFIPFTHVPFTCRRIRFHTVLFVRWTILSTLPRDFSTPREASRYPPSPSNHFYFWFDRRWREIGADYNRTNSKSYRDEKSWRIRGNRKESKTLQVSAGITLIFDPPRFRVH